MKMEMTLESMRYNQRKLMNDYMKQNKSIRKLVEYSIQKARERE